MPQDISAIAVGGETYNIKDAVARSAIASLGTVVKFQGTKTSASQILALTSANAGDLWIVNGTGSDNGEEWLCKTSFSGGADSTKWEMLGTVTQTLGDFAYADTGTVTVVPAGTVATTLSGTASTDGYGVKSAGSLPSFTEGAFSAGSLPSFTEGAFDAGSLPSFTEGSFSPGTLPSLTASYAGELLTLTFSQGTLPSKGADTFDEGDLPSKAPDTWSAGTLPSKAADTFAKGSLPTLSATVVPSSASSTFSGTSQTWTVNPAQ